MVSIQKANPSHIKMIREIAERTWWQAYKEILSEEQISFMLDTLYAEEMIKYQLENKTQTYLLVMEEGRPVAFASFAPREENPEIFKLHKLYCLPEKQQHGYGVMLVEEVERRVLGTGKQQLELNVNRQNNAKKFYERVGFSVAYEEDIPIGEFWMNDYVMRKHLKKGSGK